MSSDDISRRVVQILNEHRIPYMVVGSLSSTFHSIIRSTKDADIVVQSELGDVARLIADECKTLRLDPQLGFESVTATTKIVLRAESEEFEVEVFGLSDDPHDQQRFERRVCVDWYGVPMWMSSVEDALITKVRWANQIGRAKDIADAQNIIGVSGERIDWPYVERWCDEHGSRPLLEKIREELGQQP
jgi:hypothetical protein